MKNPNINTALWKKRISRFPIVLLVLILTLGACDDFIEVAPEDIIDAESFFSNPDELIFAVNGVYASQRSVFGSLEYFNLIEARSDNAAQNQLDRKSTRLNSSHVKISYAVFCS